MQVLQRILIVDGHFLLKAGLRALLAEETDLEVLAQADKDGEAIAAAVALTPHLLLVDKSMPGMNNTGTLAQVQRRYPAARVLLIVPNKTGQVMLASMLAGANGCIRKDATHAEFRMAIRTVLQGKPYLGTSDSGKAVNAYPAAKSSSTLDALTPRERDVLRLVAAGKSSKCIAELLSLSVKTVGKHRANLMAKLDVHNAAGLTAYAIERGLLS
jgi:DNA-binding NarL/FixJ family response regulator